MSSYENDATLPRVGYLTIYFNFIIVYVGAISRVKLCRIPNWSWKFPLCVVSYSIGRNRTGTAGQGGFCSGKMMDCMEIYSYSFMHATCENINVPHIIQLERSQSQRTSLTWTSESRTAAPGRNTLSGSCRIYSLLALLICVPH